MSAKRPMGPTLWQDSIYVALFSRGDGTFHWSIAVALGLLSARKFHATNQGGGAWRYGTSNHDIVTSRTACVVVYIGRRGNWSVDALDNMFSKIPMATSAEDGSEEFTCRIWVRQAIRQLVAARLINCPDVLALETELIGHGKSNDPTTVKGGGYKVFVSSKSA